MSRLPLESFLFRSVVLLALIVAGATFSLHHDDQRPSRQHEGGSEQQAEKVGPPKSFMDRTLDDPTAFFTAALAFLTTILAGVGAVQIRYLVRADDTARMSANAARKAAEVAERTLVASNRAWLKVKPRIGSQPILIGAERVDTSIEINFQNIGNAPAIRVDPQVWLLTWIMENTNAHDEQIRRCAEARAVSHPSQNFTLFPGESFPETEGLRGYELGVSIERKEVDFMAQRFGGQGYIMLYIGGAVTYSSASNPSVRHQTRFMFELRKADGSPIHLRDSGLAASGLSLRPMMLGMGNDAD